MEQSGLEGKELNIQTKIFSAKELIDHIYKGDSLPQDSRFLPTEEGGVFRYFHPGEIIESSRSPEKFYPVIEINNEIVGLAELQKNPYEENTYWVKFMAVDPLYQGNRYASQLVEKIFEFAKEKQATLEASSYSEEGWSKLKPVFSKISKETNVIWVDKDIKI